MRRSQEDIFKQEAHDACIFHSYRAFSCSRFLGFARTSGFQLGPSRRVIRATSQGPESEANNNEKWVAVPASVVLSRFTKVCLHNWFKMEEKLRIEPSAARFERCDGRSKLGFRRCASTECNKRKSLCIHQTMRTNSERCQCDQLSLDLELAAKRATINAISLPRHSASFPFISL